VSTNTTGTTAVAGATDKAMLKLFDMWSIDFIEWRKQLLPADSNELIRFAFDSARKRMSTVINVPSDAVVPSETGYDRRLHIKGASELVLETCTHYLDSQGVKQTLDDPTKQQIMQVIKNFATEALRTIAFAYKDLTEGQNGPEHSDIQEDSKIYDIELGDNVLICIAGIRDVIRGEVPGAVKSCKTAGVRVRMVTGDNLTTAIAIAKESRILESNDEADDAHVCMEGPEFEAYVGSLVSRKTGRKIAVFGEDPDDERIGDIERMKIVREKLKVLARSRPNDKYIMVAGLRELGDVVAVTGDGTNDAPALKKADVGFAMKTGTQVAHNASDIIIQDDNFASIVKACMWGRNVFDNIRRFLQFQLTVNVCALVVAFFGSVVLTEPPLSAIQFLWVNMIMDTLAALALATGLPTPELLNRAPYRRNEYIVNRKMTKHILGQTILQLGILFAFVFAAPTFVPEGLPEDCKNVKYAWECNDDAWWKAINIDRDVLRSHPNPRWRNWSGVNVIDGTPTDLAGVQGYSLFKEDGYSRHMTTVFNIFVWFQIFNMICSRKIDDSYNVFAGICTNPLFILIWVVICAGQFLMCQYAGRVFKVHQSGLTGVQWLYTTLPALIVFVFNALLKFESIDQYCPQLGDEPEEDKVRALREYEAIYVKPSVAKSHSARSRRQGRDAGQFM
jgi:Ca2+ transporting ATPase